MDPTTPTDARTPEIEALIAEKVEQFFDDGSPSAPDAHRLADHRMVTRLLREFSDALAVLGSGQEPAEIEALIAKFDAQLDEWDLWDSDPSEAFERLAAEFYRDTGFMAPGKSLPLEMSSVDADAERHQRYDEWIAVRKSVRRKLFRDVAAVLGRRSPQPVSATSEETLRAGVPSGDSSHGDLPRSNQSADS